MPTEKLRAIRQTLEKLHIEATYDNMSKLLGCLQALDALIEEAEKDVHADDE